jgi:predicted amidohydrolase
MKDLTVAAVCMHSPPGEVERNLERTERFVLQAAEQGAGVVCFPELSISGYVLHDPEIICSKIIQADAATRLTRMAEETGLVIMAGLMEMSRRGRPHIVHWIALPDGGVGVYRKTHLSPPEQKVYEAGSILPVFSVKGATVGLQLCYEAHFPEISTVMALMGAEILFIPHASPRGSPEKKLESWVRHLPSRAFDNAVFVVACNQVGDGTKRLKYPGVAVVLGPDGKMVGSYVGREERLLLARLEKDALRRVRQHRMRYFLPRRRPELYARLAHGRQSPPGRP